MMRCFAAAILLWFGCFTFTEATEFANRSTTEEIKLANRIVVAKCTSVDVTNLKGNIFTFAKFDVLSLIKGAEIKDNKFTLRVIGGNLGDMKMDSPLSLDFHSGQKYILFLGKENADDYPTVGSLELEVQSDNLGQEYVNNYPHDIALFNADTGKQYDTAPGHAELQNQAELTNIMSSTVQHLKDKDLQTYKNFQAAGIQAYDVPPKNLPLKDFIFSLQKIVGANAK